MVKKRSKGSRASKVGPTAAPSTIEESSQQPGDGGTIRGAPAPSGTPSAQQANPNLELSPSFEEWIESPCKCCCPLATAAKVLPVVNLIYLVVVLLTLVMKGVKLAGTVDNRGGLGRDIFEEMRREAAWRDCWLAQTVYASGLYMIIMSLLTIITAGCVVATVLFIVAVHIGSSDKKYDSLFCKLYMWSNFCNPTGLFVILIFNDMLGYGPACSEYLSTFVNWMGFFLLGLGIAVYNVFNGLVGRAYGNQQYRPNPSVP